MLMFLPVMAFQETAAKESAPKPTLAEVMATATPYEKKRIEFYRNMPWDGIRVRGLYEKLPDGHLVVYMVIPDSPGARAGIQPGDIILTMNGEDVSKFNSSSLFHFMTSLEIGEDLIYVIKRDGKELKVPVTLTAPLESIMAEWMLEFREKKKKKMAEGTGKDGETKDW